MLQNMTSEWARAANSIAVYVLLAKAKKQSPKDAISEYNRWLHWSGMTISSSSLAVWCANYILLQFSVSEPLAQEALALDRIPIISGKPIPTI